jgi:hypothetical protein
VKLFAHNRKVRKRRRRPKRMAKPLSQVSEKLKANPRASPRGFAFIAVRMVIG